MFLVFFPEEATSRFSHKLTLKSQVVSEVGMGISPLKMFVLRY